MEFAAEATYPVSETYSAGVLLSSSQLLSIIVNVLVGWMIDRYDVAVAQIPGLAISFIAFIVTLFITEDLRRLK